MRFLTGDKGQLGYIWDVVPLAPIVRRLAPPTVTGWVMWHYFVVAFLLQVWDGAIHPSILPAHSLRTIGLVLQARAPVVWQLMNELVNETLLSTLGNPKIGVLHARSALMAAIARVLAAFVAGYVPGGILLPSVLSSTLSSNLAAAVAT